MSQLPVTIPKQPALKPAEDYYRLRRDGIGFLAQMCSQLWTDYNTHDPGITILEALCYAITDLAYRAGWDIKDLLAPAIPSPDQSQPYPGQAFFSARNILSVNPTTPDDFRRLLIDLETVRDAWVSCQECACEQGYYAWCDKGKLVLSYQPPPGVTPAPEPIRPRGLYRALLELESDPELGDLNDRKIEYNYISHDKNGSYATLMEMRFPPPDPSASDLWALFLGSDDAFAGRHGASFTLQLDASGAAKGYDLFGDPDRDQEEERDSYLRGHWRDIFFLSFTVTLQLPKEAGSEEMVTHEIAIANAALRVFGNASAKNATTAAGWKALFEGQVGAELIQRYRKKMQRQRAAVQAAQLALAARRNLDEDFCGIAVVGVEEVAVCADVEVQPDADIERVQASIWFEIERYFNPPVPFYTLQELLDDGVPVEEIFNGPALESGFLRDSDLAAAALKPVLRVSDLINRLMDIEGVIAVNQLQLTKYDSEGHVVKGAADPTWRADGKAIPSDKISASWLMYLSPRHQPRLYLNASRFLFYKNGLPFLPRMDEAGDTLTQMRGETLRPLNQSAPKDLPVPAGNYREPEDYFPVQYSFPLSYGIGPDGLPSQASSERQAQAKQLKAYLMVFEQLLGNSFAQLAHAADLFSLDPKTQNSYFVLPFSGENQPDHKELILGFSEIVDSALDGAALQALAETGPEFHERRNRFLDHVMARFGEQFSEYALLLSNLQGEQVALDQLIKDKIAFIKAYPLVSHDRGRAFNYRLAPNLPANQPGIKERVCLLLGVPDLSLRMLVVEHLLLRPKFPGDALYPACSDGPCRTCGDEDPYSFRLSFVMPGWTAPFNTNLEMRGFADRTIRQETPSHLLGKTCWVANDGFIEKPGAPIINQLAQLLMKRGAKNADGIGPALSVACDCAAALHTTFNDSFKAWYQDKILDPVHPDTLQKGLETEFAARVDRSKIACAIALDTDLWADIQAIMAKYFLKSALNGWQFERFEAAWRAWLEANARFDWSDERLQERVQAILTDNLKPVARANLSTDAMCSCAALFLSACGMAFHDWMGDNVKGGKSFEDIALFTPPAIKLCDDFQIGTGKTLQPLQDLLHERYNAYREVSYRLWMVVGLLSQLSNTYPAATLHDWDAGSDQNPVRLGQTALGS